MAEAFRWAGTPQGLKRAGIRLCGATWILFVVSMFLPAFVGTRCISIVLIGYECAWITLTQRLMGLYNFSFALANVLMLISPLLMRRILRGRGRGGLSFLLLTLAFVDAFSMLFRYEDSGYWSVGYYCGWHRLG